MLHSLELENFKAFGNRVHIPFAPITLIFGQNSSGKSSILQSLHLLKQTVEKRIRGIEIRSADLLPKMENGIVDLGRFQDLLYEHDLNRSLKIRIDLDLSKRVSYENFESGHLNISNLQHFKIFGMEYSFSQETIEKDIQLNFLSLFIEEVKEPVANFEVLPSTKFYDGDVEMFVDPLIIGKNDLSLALALSISKDHNLWQDSFSYYKRKSNRITEILKQELDEFDRASKLYTIDHDSKEDWDRNIKDFRDAIQFYSSDFTIDSFIERMKKIFENKFERGIGIDGFIPVNEVMNPLLAPEFRAPNSFFESSNNYNIPNFGGLAVVSGKYINEFFKRLFPLGPFRRPPERWYTYTGAKPMDVGYHGNFLPDFLFRTPALVKDTNKWLEALDIGYQIVVNSLGSKVKELFEIALIDTRSNNKVAVGLSDVGFGISQILPLIVQCLSSTNRTITIEQPELHIHPRLQADLGNLLAESIKEPRRNQFVIETHSEHLILRLQRLIREGILKPTDISVINVQREENGSIINHLVLDEDGDFIDDWPGGFFPERLKELQ